MPVHLASDRLIKNVIGSVNHVLVQRGVGLAGGRAAVAVTGGRPDNRITAENERIKGEDANVTQSPPKHGRHPEALGTVTEACDCWVLLEGGRVFRFLCIKDVALMQIHRRVAPVRPSEGQQTCADVGRSPLWCCTFVSWLMESQPAGSRLMGSFTLLCILVQYLFLANI